MATKKKATVKVSNKKSKSTKSTAKKDSFSFTDLPDELAERGREIWLAGLGALSMVEEEGSKLFSTLVSKGETWEKEGRKQIGAAKDRLDAARGKMEAAVEGAVEEAAEKGSKLTELDDVVLGKLEDTVERVLQRLGVPTHAEVKDLSGKVDKLSSEVVALAAVMEKGAKGTNGTAEKTVFHVVPADEGWAVKAEGVDEPLSVHETKKDALEAGRGLAKASAPSRLVPHRKDGTVQENLAYEA